MSDEKQYKTYIKRDKFRENEIVAFFMKRVCLGDEDNDYYNFVETNLRVSVKEDGSMSISNQDNDSFIYIYPDQIEQFYQFVKIAKEHKK